MKKVFGARKIIAFICIFCLMLGTISPQLAFAEEMSQTEGLVTQTEAAAEAETAAQADSDSVAASGIQPDTSVQADTQARTDADQDTTAEADSATDAANTVVIASEADGEAASSTTDGIQALKEERTETAALAATGDDDTSAADAEGINLADGTYLTGYRLSYLDGNDYKTITSDTVVPVYTTLKMTVNFGGISAQGLLDKGGKLYIEIPGRAEAGSSDGSGDSSEYNPTGGERLYLRQWRNFLHCDARSGADPDEYNPDAEAWQSEYHNPV